MAGFIGVFGGAFAAFLLLGLVRILVWRRRWRRGGPHGCHGGGWHGRRGWRHGPHGAHGGPGGLGEERFARAAGEVLKRRLHVDEEQEPVVDHALKDLRAALAELGKEMGELRGPVAEAFRGETVDDAALAAAFAKQDDAVARARREVVSALKQVHAVLDAEQRGRGADMLAKGPGRWA